MSSDTREGLRFTSESYLEAKAFWKGTRISHSRALRRAPGSSMPYEKGRDPKPLASVLERVAEEMGWTTTLRQAMLIEEWPALVGENVARHTEVVSITHDLLEVRCDSTAWATELRRLRGEILTKIHHAYGETTVRDIRFLAPGAPSWKHGRRTVPGRGPRDTYG